MRPSPEQLRNLLGRYFPGGAEQVREIAEGLDLSRRGGFQAPEKILVVLFPSRAGSSFFGQLLSSTGWFKEIQESFRPEQLAKIRARHGLPDSHAAAQWMIDNRGTAHAFGFKAGFIVLAAAAELGFLSDVLDRARFVLLRRRDRVAQAVSLVKIKLTKRTHSGQPETRVLGDDDYDGEAIASEVRNIEQVEAQLADFAARLGVSAPVFYYEDICDRPTEHVARVCDLLGLPMPADYRPEVRLTVLRDELSLRWAERFRSESAI